MHIESTRGPQSAGASTTLQRLRAVGRGEEPETLLFSTPAPVVAFGRRDELSPRFPEAAEAARNQGFEAWVRPVGGRAAAYHGRCLVVDHLCPDPDPTSGNLRRYRELGDLYALALGDLGVPAAVGELPREYCPGEYSVHGVLPDGSRTKLVGTAQRVVAGAWWFSAAVVVADRDPLVRVLAAVYERLGLPLDPATAGSLEQFHPEIRVEDVEDAVTARLEARSRWSHG